MAPALTANEKKWRQEDDAFTLSAAEQIKADPARLKGAAVAAKRMLAEKQEQMQNLSKVANPRVVNPKVAKAPPKRIPSKSAVKPRTKK